MFDVNKIPKPLIARKIDFDNNTIVMCPTLYMTETAPTDQSPCIVEKCPSCEYDMWVSERKRQHRATHANVKIYCIACVIANQKAQGIRKEDVEIIDLLKMN